MKDIDIIYSKLLTSAFISLQRAVEVDDLEWMDAEVEAFHNVPSLIGEQNYLRHKYYWEKERTTYIEWALQPGHESAKSMMTTFYQPFWQQLEPLIKAMNS